MKHIPTPWAIQYSYEDGHHIGPDRYTTICTVRNGADDEEYGGKEGELANAAFIVRACNSHDRLVRALQIALDYAKDNYTQEQWMQIAGEALLFARGEA